MRKYSRSTKPWVRSFRKGLGYLADVAADFGNQQSLRLQMRVRAFRFAVVSALFWTVFLLFLSALVSGGAQWLAVTLFVSWILLSIPAVLLQLSVFLDLVLYATSGRMLVFPMLHTAYSLNSPRTEVEFGRLTFWKHLVLLTVRTSPLSGMATWAFSTLYTMLCEQYEAGQVSVLEYRRAKEARDVPDTFLMSLLTPYWASLERNAKQKTLLAMQIYKAPRADGLPI